MFGEAIKDEIVVALAASLMISLPAYLYMAWHPELRYVACSMFCMPSTTDRETVNVHVFPLIFRPTSRLRQGLLWLQRRTLDELSVVIA